MKLKEITAMAAAFAITLSLAVPASATSRVPADKFKEALIYRATMPETVIDVSIPDASSVKLVANPRSLTVDLADPITTVSGTSTETSANFIFTPLTIESGSNVPLSVSATVKGTLSTGVKFVTKPISGLKTPPTSKQVFLFLEVVGPEQGYTFADDYNAKAGNQILIGTTAKTQKNMVVIPAKSGSTNGTAKFRMTGDMTPDSKVVWTTSDRISVNMVFAFTAVPVGTTG